MKDILKNKLEQLLSDYNTLKTAVKAYGATKDNFSTFSQEDKIKIGAMNFRVTVIPGEFILLYELLAENFGSIWSEDAESQKIFNQYNDFKETLGNFVKVENGEIVFDEKIKRFLDGTK